MQVNLSWIVLQHHQNYSNRRMLHDTPSHKADYSPRQGKLHVCTCTNSLKWKLLDHFPFKADCSQTRWVMLLSQPHWLVQSPKHLTTTSPPPAHPNLLLHSSRGPNNPHSLASVYTTHVSKLKVADNALQFLSAASAAGHIKLRPLNLSNMSPLIATTDGPWHPNNGRSKKRFKLKWC